MRLDLPFFQEMNFARHFEALIIPRDARVVVACSEVSKEPWPQDPFGPTARNAIYSARASRKGAAKKSAGDGPP
jgi:hypothetical protein